MFEKHSSALILSFYTLFRLLIHRHYKQISSYKISPKCIVFQETLQNFPVTSGSSSKSLCLFKAKNALVGLSIANFGSYALGNFSIL